MSHQQALTIILLLDGVFALVAALAAGLRCGPDGTGKYPISILYFLVCYVILVVLQLTAGLL